MRIGISDKVLGDAETSGPGTLGRRRTTKQEPGFPVAHVVQRRLTPCGISELLPQSGINFSLVGDTVFLSLFFFKKLNLCLNTNITGKCYTVRGLGVF